MIYFKEHSSYGYSGRTLHNVNSSDATLALAIDFKTGGEICTRNYCDKLKKPYFRIDFNYYTDRTLDQIRENLIALNVKTLNIAGNGLYTFKGVLGQPGIDSWVLGILRDLTYFMDIESFISGGQTGVDEAGLKAGDKLGFKTVCTAPKGWMYRNVNGVDIRNEEKFKCRFGLIYDIL